MLNWSKESKLQKVQALYNFEKGDDAELSFNRGDVLEVLASNGDWWRCKLGNKTGLIPANYVKILKEQEEATLPGSLAVPKGIVPTDTSKESKLQKVQALYNFEKGHDTELSFNRGDVLEVLVSNWWRGKLGNKTGLIPANYVKILKEQEDVTPTLPGSSAAPKGNIAPTNISKDSKLQKAQALYNFEKADEIELSFNKGDVLEVLDSNSNSDWWRCKLGNKIGRIPANYVKVFKEQEETATSVVRAQTKKKVDEKKKVKNSLPISTIVSQSTILPQTKLSDSVPSLILAHPPSPEIEKTKVVSLLESFPIQKEISAKILAQSALHLSFQISYIDFTFGEKLGQGGFGAVYKGIWQHTPVAIKQLTVGKLSIEGEQEFHNEAAIMAQLRHANIIQFYGVCVDQKPYCMVMEYMSEGSLKELLHSQKPLEWSQKESIAFDITKGLYFLHHRQPPILHRDLKSLNVLLDDRLQAKLCDFGLAKVKQETSSSSQKGGAAGTVAWMAPELLEEGAKHTLASDVYSYGMVLWELTSRRFPYSGYLNPVVAILRGKQETIPEGTPPYMAKLISRCWDSRAENRPSIDEAIQSLPSSSKTSNVSIPTPSSSSHARSTNSSSSDPEKYRESQPALSYRS